MTDDLVGDTAKLDRFDRALLFGWLGDIWWDIDQGRAREWMRKAINGVEATSIQEEDHERNQRLTTARALLAIIAKRDEKLSLKLTSLFIPKSSYPTNGGKIEDATALIDAALAILNEDPKRAAELGSASLRISPSYRLASLLWRMRRIDINLANTLFTEVLAVARTAYDLNLLNALISVAFRGPAPSDELKTKILVVVAEGLLRLSAQAKEKVEPCKLATMASNLLDHFNRLLPQQAALVQFEVRRCQDNALPGSEQEVNEAMRESQLKTIEDFLKAAQETTEPKKDEYLAKAAYMAFEQKDYDRAISILEEISDSGRNAMNGTWESWRATFAGMAAAAYVKRGDWQSMARVVANTPLALRAFVRIFVLDALSAQDNRDGIIEFLYQARKDLANATEENRADWLIILLHRYVKFVPADAPLVLSETIAAINRVKHYDPKGGNVNEDAGNKILDNELLLKSYSLPVQLFEIDYLGVRQSIANIEAPTIRAAVRLNLLRTSLEKHRSTKKPKTVTPKSGG
ncbi:MAG TPA: hypothetical protein VF791_04315 [Pyrinomonadaceae bacterium]